MNDYLISKGVEIPSKFIVLNLSILFIVFIILLCSHASSGWLHNNLDRFWWKYFIVGIMAGGINGIIGMGYGITVVTSLLSLGFSSVVASSVVHFSEIFAAGSNGLIHYRYRNVNKKTFKKLLIPSILGALAGSTLLYSLNRYQYIVKPLISFYILVMGCYIIYKAFHKTMPGKKTKQLYAVGFISAIIDAIGGGWQTLVSTTIIAGGRSALYTIGSVSCVKFFVALTTSITLVAFTGHINWQVIFWIILGNIWIGPIGPYIARKLPRKAMMVVIGITVLSISMYQLILLPFD